MTYFVCSMPAGVSSSEAGGFASDDATGAETAVASDGETPSGTTGGLDAVVGSLAGGVERLVESACVDGDETEISVIVCDFAVRFFENSDGPILTILFVTTALRCQNRRRRYSIHRRQFAATVPHRNDLQRAPCLPIVRALFSQRAAPETPRFPWLGLRLL